MGRKISAASLVVVAVLAMPASNARADSFGAGVNQFSLEFVAIAGDINPTDVSRSGGYGVVDYDYRMGVYEITNEQWNKFTANLGAPPTGVPSYAYNGDFHDYGTGATDVPANNISWYEAAQLVNWLNTSTGHQAAYRFTGTQGQSDYAFDTWGVDEAAGGTNLYRHKDAFYFLPTEHEWVKAAYFNGTALQEYATKDGDIPHQGDGSSGTGWNYRDPEYAMDPRGTWDVGSGSEELNGTYDMMGNLPEWVESPRDGPIYTVNASRGIRNGDWGSLYNDLAVPRRSGAHPSTESDILGFRVASGPQSVASIAGDLNDDGVVNSQDLDLVRGYWGEDVEPGNGLMGDATGDGHVDSADLDAVRANWGAGVGVVPEPSVLLLLVGSAVFLTWRRNIAL